MDDRLTKADIDDLLSACSFADGEAVFTGWEPYDRVVRKLKALRATAPEAERLKKAEMADRLARLRGSNVIACPICGEKYGCSCKADVFTR